MTYIEDFAFYLFKLINCPCNAKYNAWEIFCIIKFFTLSLIATVTFSVMFIQIKQSIKYRQNMPFDLSSKSINNNTVDYIL